MFVGYLGSHRPMALKRLRRETGSNKKCSIHCAFLLLLLFVFFFVGFFFTMLYASRFRVQLLRLNWFLLNCIGKKTPDTGEEGSSLLLDNELKLNQYLITAQNSKFIQRHAKVAQNQKLALRTRDGKTELPYAHPDDQITIRSLWTYKKAAHHCKEMLPIFHCSLPHGPVSSVDPSISMAWQYQHPIQHTFRLYYRLEWIWETE